MVLLLLLAVAVVGVVLGGVLLYCFSVVLVVVYFAFSVVLVLVWYGFGVVFSLVVVRLYIGVQMVSA